MKVGHSADKPAPLPATAPASAAQTAQDTAKASASTVTGAIPTTADPSAKIELSSAAATLLDNAAAGDFDADKVARVSQSIADGSFKIDAEVIADKLIGNAKELLTRVKP